MAADNTKKDFREKTFDQEWIVKNWSDVFKDESLLEKTSIEIQCRENNLEYANFLVGLKIVSVGEKRTSRFYWKLLRNHYYLNNVEADLIIQLMLNNGKLWLRFESHDIAVPDKTIDINGYFLSFPLTLAPNKLVLVTSSDGSLKINLKLTLKNLPDLHLKSKLKDFRKLSFRLLLDDKLSFDVKIITKDNIELLAHKLILRAQCPVFASMFGSDFLESSTSLVRVDDISSKTMKILLKYWYSGELMTSWKDNDVIVEFVYAAGKYQMDTVLKMLDETLGFDFEEFEGDVGLLKMVCNLSLKNAEARLLAFILDKVRQISSGAELLNFVSFDAKSIEAKDYLSLDILKEFDSVCSEQDDMEASARHVILLALACQLGLKHAESKILKRIVSTVEKMKSADELFALFEVKNEKFDNDSNEADMLVRANQM